MPSKSQNASRYGPDPRAKFGVFALATERKHPRIRRHRSDMSASEPRPGDDAKQIASL
jgi:hypothetical protein